MTLFGKGVFAKVIQLKISRGGHSGLKWTLNPVTSVLKRRGEKTCRRLCEDGGRDWNNSSQVTPETTRRWKSKEGFFLKDFEGIVIIPTP